MPEAIVGQPTNGSEDSERTAGMPGVGNLLLEASGLEKHYGGVTALSEASFSGRAGEVHALLGENGAGKSTFVKVVTGEVALDAGVLRVEGELVERLTPVVAREKGIAAVNQELSLVPVLTGAENMWFPREPVTRFRSRSRRRMLAQSRALLAEMGLPDVPLDVPVHELAIAARQLIEIGKALAKRPRILILDEATSALGPTEVAAVMATLRRLAADGVLCLYISHRLAEVKAIADRFTVFRSGRTVATFDAGTMNDEEIVQHIIGRRLENLYPPRADRAKDSVVLQARGLTAGHRLRGVDLDVHAGEILGVGGLQDQGQLQLFLRLFGAMRGRGEISINGEPVSIRSPKQALGVGVGCAFIPEDRQREGLLLTKSVRENLSLSRLGEVSRHGVVRRHLETALTQDVVDRFSVALHTREQPVGELSGGNQQKIVIGKFLLPHVQVLLWYDPARGVDVGAKYDIFKLMEDQAAEGKAILFFSTDAEELTNLCDRVLVLANGRAVATIEKTELSTESLIRAALALQEG